MSRLDVVAELAAHQQHLVPEPVASRRVVIVLPAPALCRLIAPGIELRILAPMNELAEQLGGGDGPLAIVSLERRVTTQLAALWARGVRELIVYGACDQPGHARALRYRWPGALQVLEGAWLDELFELREPIRVLAPGVVRVAPGVAAPKTVACVLAAVGAEEDPRRVAAQGPHVWPYAVDRARQLGAWSGVVPPAARLGTAAGAELRARWEAHWIARGHDVVRPAVLGLDPVLEADLREPASAPPVARRAQLIAITGIDGAGKSSQAARLGDALRARGARVRVLKLYRQGAFLALANELGARTRRGASLAAFRVSREVKLVDSLRVYRDHLAAAIAACDAVILDRYVETHVAAAESQLGWALAAHPALAPFPPPDLECFLQLDPAVALARRAARGEPASADEHAIGLRGYAEVFARLAAASGAVVLDASAPAADNARSILGRVAVTASGAADAERPNTAAARVAPGAPRRVQIGGDAALGADVFALRAELARWCGPVASGIPEAFWLEVYAAQLVLDVLTGADGTALALWPSAIAAMAGHGELDLLLELERMLAPLVMVEHYDPRAACYEPAFRALGATAGAARRLARDYAAQLERIAAAQGWARAPSA